MTNYYDHKALSYSAIKRYLTDGPHSFWRHSLFNPNRVPEESTKAMIEGNAAHSLLLEPAQFGSRYAVKDKIDGRTKEGKAYNEQFALTVGTKEVIDSECYANLITMVDAIKAHPEYKSNVSNFKVDVEHEIFVELDGTPFKAKPDIVVGLGTDNPIIFDYKSCQNCDPLHFRKDVVNLRYYIQDALYKGIYEAKYGVKPRFVFIPQEVDYPENIAFYELGAADTSAGLRELNRAVREIKHRLETNNWKPYAGGIQQLEMPTWFYTRQQEEELVA